MGINFPSTPAEGQVINISPGKSFVFKSGLWRKAPMTTAMPKNYLVNPAMQISQQNSIPGTASDFYAADQWAMSLAGGTGWNLSRSTTTSPNGSSSVLLSNGTKDQSNSVWYGDIYQPIEGLRAADLQWGTPNAKQIVVRFWTNFATTGLGYLAIQNPNQNRTWLGQISSTPVSTWVRRRLLFLARQQAYGLLIIPRQYDLL